MNFFQIGALLVVMMVVILWLLVVFDRDPFEHYRDEGLPIKPRRRPRSTMPKDTIVTFKPGWDESKPKKRKRS